MKIVGLITEYNPFHNGHQYHIHKAKEVTGADYVIAVMSGDFVQRGVPAFLPKHLRTEMALYGDCDMVIELPVRYATGSAEYFASGAIKILDGLGCVDSVCFGSECGDYESLDKIARTLLDEPSEFKNILQNNLRKGMNFPQARQNALEMYFNDANINAIIKEPNNILGIEYIKAMLKLNSSMKGYTIPREGSAYHDNNLSEKFSSASAIRKHFAGNDIPVFEELKKHMPSYAVDILEKTYNIRYPVSADDFSLILRYKLLSETKESLTEYADITPDLANRIINSRNRFRSFTQFCDLLKTKELTYSRISRCLMHILLNIRDISYSPHVYARVLGFRIQSADLFTIIKNKTQIPVITKVSIIADTNVTGVIKQDIFASDLYENIISNKYNIPFINESEKMIVKI